MFHLTSFFIISTSLIFSFHTAAFAQTVRATCVKSTANDPVIYGSEFSWGYNLDGLKVKFTEMYSSPKRLYNRAYYDSDLKSYVMNFISGDSAQPVRLSEGFLKSVRRHIEVSLQRHYADAVFFPDMGHSHLFLPLALKKELDAIPYPQSAGVFYEKVFNSPEVKILYHTAEQLVLREGERNKGPVLSDPYLQWRYYSRNVIGQNDGSDNVATVFAFGERYNTLHDLVGYEYWGTGFNLSANKEGCFEFTQDGKTFYFDLSFDDLPSDPSQGGGDT